MKDLGVERHLARRIQFWTVLVGLYRSYEDAVCGRLVVRIFIYFHSAVTRISSSRKKIMRCDNMFGGCEGEDCEGGFKESR